MKLSLVVVKGKPEGAQVPINGAQFLIGRDKRCNLRPNNESVSKVHCAIRIVGDSVVLYDMESMNGTFVNDTRVERKVVLKDGDEIGIATLGLRIQIEAPKPEAVLDAGDDGFVDDMMDWLDNKEPSNGQPGAIVGGEDQSEPSLDETTMEMRASSETQEIIAKDPAETMQPRGVTRDPDERRFVSPSKPAQPGNEMKGTSAAADNLLQNYLVRKRQSS